MIARTWHGRVPLSRADAYESYIHRTGITDILATPGNQGVLLTRRDEGDVTHFNLTSLWESTEAIRRFAGDDYARARYYDEDDDYLLEREPHVTHSDVLSATISAVPTDAAPR